MSVRVWNMCSRSLSWGEKPLVMGILNVTPDSFSDGGRFVDVARAVEHGVQMARDGADMIDVGGESTRPGAVPVSEAEELARVVPVVRELQGKVKAAISIDTTKSAVARAALEAGADVVNDVSGGEWDRELWPVVASLGAGYVLMHCQGHPATMQVNPVYGDVVGEVQGYLRSRLGEAVAAGIAAERIVCDVGFGFGKTFEHNLELLRRLGAFADLGRPLLVGVSRKSFVKKLGGEEQLSLSTELVHLWSAAQGAAIWRVHDVKSASVTAGMVGQLRREVRD